MQSRMVHPTLIVAAAFSVQAVLSTPSLAQCVEGCRVIHTFTGENVGDTFGWVSNSLGDIDADGIDDFVTTAAFYGASNVGRMYAYSGVDGSLALPILSGPTANGSLGFAATSAGDVDNDGVLDIIGSAPGIGAGRAFVYSGATGLVIRTYQGEVFADIFGSGVAGLGDINADGHSDVLIGAPQRSAPGVQQGRIYVYSGLDSNLLCQANGEGANHRFGETVAKVKDINSDGIADFVVGAKDAGSSSVGRAYVFSGADCVGGATIIPFFTLQPTGTAVDFGLYFMDSGDMNGDGTPDIYVSDFSANRVHIFSGVNGSLLRAINGSGGFGIGRFIGDVDGDGHDDLILGSWIDNTGGTQAGMAEVLSGRDARVLERYTHNVPFAQFGYDAHGMHDVDGDGMTDYVVTAANDSNATGKAYLLAGNVAPVPSTPRCLVPGWASGSVQAFDITDGTPRGTLVASGSGGLANAHSVVIGPDRMLYVSSAATNRVLRYHPVTGAFVGAFANPAGTPMNLPMDAIFGPDGHLYVASFGSGHVLRFNGVTGAYMGVFATGPGPLEVEMLAFGPDGHLYVANGERSSVTRYDGATGAPLPGPLGAPGTADFVLPNAGGLDDPHSLAFGPDGNLYIASFDTSRVIRFNGTTGAFLNNFVTPGSGGLVAPHGSTFGPGGDLFVGSVGTNQVLRYDGATGAFEGVFIQGDGTGLSQPMSIHFMRHPADLDDDFDVDSDDADLFATCISGRGVPLMPGCEPSDFDRDGDVDCGDGANFNRGWTGPPSMPPLFSCPENCLGTLPVLDEIGGFAKSRFISFAPTPAGSATAIRVTLNSLHHPDPPYTAGSATDFSALEGQTRWVGPPTQYVESQSAPTPFWVAMLQCEPYYTDWSSMGLLHVSGSEIVPSSLYDVQVIREGCTSSEAANYSLPVMISTSRWGDVTDPFNPPSASVQPDISDVSALVDKFRSAPGAPIKARGILAGAPGNAFGEVTHDVLNVDFGFSHISACVDAFRGVPYPYTIAGCP